METIPERLPQIYGSNVATMGRGHNFLFSIGHDSPDLTIRKIFVETVAGMSQETGLMIINLHDIPHMETSTYFVWLSVMVFII